MGRKRNSKVVLKIFILLFVIVAIFGSGYVFLDKMIVPKYFGQYGINGVGDLIGVVNSLYKNPKESSFITNGYTQTDLSSAITKLQDANYTIKDDGTIDKSNFLNGDEIEVILTDREFAAVCNSLLKNGILSSVLPELKYINNPDEGVDSRISILELTITPIKSQNETSEETDEIEVNEEDLNVFQKANIEFIAKIDTTDVREQISVQMDTPMFLLNMIIPNNLYFKVSYDIDLSAEEDERITNGNIAINGRTEDQSKILINLLVQFIFPEDENMNKEKFTSAFGDIIMSGIDVLGDFSFIENIGSSNQCGIIVNKNNV